MKENFKSILLVVLMFFALLFIFTKTKAQDPQLSQFYSVPTYLGPSFAGATNGSRAVLNFRDQWPGMNNAYVTYALSYDRNLPKFKSGVGFIALRDQAGEIEFSRNYLGLQYAYEVKLGNLWVLRPGLTFYYLRTNYDITEVRFGHQINTLTGEQTSFTKHGLLDQNQNNFDFSSSVLLYANDYWFGLTVDHIARPNASMSEQKSIIPIKFTNYGGYKFNFNKDRVGRHKERSITAAYFYKKQGTFDQFDVGGYWTREPLNLGLWYRGLPLKNKNVDEKAINHDAIIFLFGIKYYQFQFSYNYDITISKMYTNSHGAHEISIIYLIPYKEPKRRIEPLPCPWF